MLASTKRVVAAHLAAAAILAAGVAASPSAGQPAPPYAFPDALEKYFTTEVQPTALERSTLLSGGAVAKLLDADPGVCSCPTRGAAGASGS